MTFKVKLIHLIKSNSSDSVTVKKKKKQNPSEKNLSYDSLSSIDSHIATQRSSNCVILNETNESNSNNIYYRSSKSRNLIHRKYNFSKVHDKVKDKTKFNKHGSLCVDVITKNTNEMEVNINNTTSDVNPINYFTNKYSFYSYFYPSETDEGLLPFAKQFQNSEEKTYFSSTEDPSKPMVSNFNKTDRRLKMIENKCGVEIKIGSIEDKLIRGLPRRKVTIFSQTHEKIASALSCIENAIPELLEKALFTEPLNCKTHNWPTTSGLFIRQLRKSKFFHKRALNCPLGNSSWSNVIDPKKIFPFKTASFSMRTSVLHNTNKITSKNNITPINVDLEIVKEAQTEQSTDLTTKSLSTTYMKNYVMPNDSKDNNNNNNKLNESEITDCRESSLINNKTDLMKYLKFPFSEECDQLFQFNQAGEPVNKKFQNSLKMSKCKVLNIKRQSDENGKLFYYVKIYYQNPANLVKLFLLLNFQIKY